jgi:transcriptional regulator with XRE-family HTH domain
MDHYPGVPKDHTWIDQLKLFAARMLEEETKVKPRGARSRVAAKLPLDKSTLTKLLEGKRAGVAHDTLQRIAEKHKDFAAMLQLVPEPTRPQLPESAEAYDVILDLVQNERIDAAGARALRAHIAALGRAPTKEEVERFMKLYGRTAKKEPSGQLRRISDRPPR